MKTAVIVHGKPGEEEYYDENIPSASNFHWIPWLQNQLLTRDIHAQTPEIPHAFKPQYEVWKKEFERFDIDEDTILVGHSCGGGFLVRWLSENKVTVGNVILVAPWLDPTRRATEAMFDFDIDQDLAKRTKSLTIFNSTDDAEDIHNSVDVIRKSVKEAEYVEFTDKGHFTLKAMGTDKFPELLKEVLKNG